MLRAIIPLRPRFVPHCGLRSINASPRCRPLRLLASLKWLHIVFIPCRRTSLSCWQSPLRSLTGVAHAIELPQFLQGCRGLTTTFRSVGQTTTPQAPLSSARSATVRRQVAGFITALMLCDENKPHPPQSVARHPPKNACGFLSAANASSPTPV